MAFDWGGLIGGAANIGSSIFSFLQGNKAMGMAEDMYGASQQLTEAQAALILQMMGQSGEQWEYWKQYELPIQQQLSEDYLNTYLPMQKQVAQSYMDYQLPLENQILGEAMEGVKPRYDTVVGQATADVAQGFGKAREESERALGRYGIDPNSGKFADAQRLQDLAQSAMTAGARTNAREGETRRIEDTNWGRKVQAAGLKRGLAYPAPSGGFGSMAMNTQGQALAGAGNAAGQYANLGNTAAGYGAQSMYGFGQGLNRLAGTGSGSFQGLWNSLSGLFGAKEYGGTVREGERYIVGEAGPEVFEAPTDGIILPNPATMEQMERWQGGGGGDGGGSEGMGGGMMGGGGMGGMPGRGRGLMSANGEGYGDGGYGARNRQAPPLQGGFPRNIPCRTANREDPPMDMIQAGEISDLIRRLIEITGGRSTMNNGTPLSGEIVLRQG